MKFPKKLYAKIEGKKGDEYISSYESLDSTVDAGESVKLGVYELVDTVEASGSVTVVSTKSTRRGR